MIRKQSAEEQLATMQRLINFGKADNSSNVKEAPIVEFKKMAANGKTYGIIRESSKYYIMEAPQKDTEVLAEDFDFIGGFNNKKENEFSSYTKASNALDLKIMSINEAVDKANRVATTEPVVTSEWETKITEGMRNEINRFKMITENSKRIDEGQEALEMGAPAKNTVSKEEEKQPFNEETDAKLDKDLNVNGKDPKVAGEPFNEKAVADMEFDGKDSDGKDTYTDDPVNVDDKLGTARKKGIKENNTIRLKLTEEQVLAWNDSQDYMDTSHGTEIGATDPYEICEGDELEIEVIDDVSDINAVHNTFDQNSPEPGTSEVGDTSPYEEIKESREDFEDYPFPDVAREEAGIEDDDELDDEEPVDNFEKEEREYVIDFAEPELDDEEAYNEKNLDGLDVDLKNWNVFDDEDDYVVDDDLAFESRRRGRTLSEDKLNVFGKHPAYRKVPMTTPANKEVAINGAREWDDESAQGEEPFGKKIGDSSPYTEIVNAMTESIISSLYGNKKKV